jgi:hypothetical protein
MGAIPVISSLTSKQYTLLTRLYAVHFLQKVVSNNDTLQMLVACRGLGSLSDLLTDSEFEKNVELVYLSIDCISNILKVSSPVCIFLFCYVLMNIALSKARIYLFILKLQYSREIKHYTSEPCKERGRFYLFK